MFRRKSKSKTSETTNATLRSLRETIKDYVGYDNVRERDATDKSLRRYLYDLILSLIDSFSAVQTQLMQAQLLSTWSASNAIRQMLDNLREFLTQDVYRHSTFFETPDVSENLEISVLYLLESETILEMRSVKDKMDATTEKLQNLDLMDIETDILSIKSRMESVHLTISDRAELIASFEIVGL